VKNKPHEKKKAAKKNQKNLEGERCRRKLLAGIQAVLVGKTDPACRRTEEYLLLQNQVREKISRPIQGG